MQYLESQISMRQKGIDDLMIKNELIVFFNAIYKSLSLKEKLLIAVKIDNDIKVDDYCKNIGISRSKYQREVKKVIDKLKCKLGYYTKISMNENVFVPDWAREVLEKKYEIMDDALGFEFMSYKDILAQMGKI